jgi:hypothetical protein
MVDVPADTTARLHRAISIKVVSNGGKQTAFFMCPQNESSGKRSGEIGGQVIVSSLLILFGEIFDKRSPELGVNIKI